MRDILFLTILTLILAGCTQDVGVQTTQTANAESQWALLNTMTGTLPPSVTSTPTSTGTITPSPTLPPTITPRPTFTSTPAPTKVLPTDIYPVPSPFLTPVAWGNQEGCPNPAGLHKTDVPAIEEIEALIRSLYSGDVEEMRMVSDPAYWPLVESRSGYTDVVEADWLAINPARDTPYISLIEIGCGRAILDLSFWVVDCRAPCADTNRPIALESHFFIINRLGIWLIWASYP